MRITLRIDGADGVGRASTLGQIRERIRRRVLLRRQGRIEDGAREDRIRGSAQRIGANGNDV